jgi:hypothetical protein
MANAMKRETENETIGPSIQPTKLCPRSVSTEKVGQLNMPTESCSGSPTATDNRMCAVRDPLIH